jgi:hypothetical protein
MHRDRISLVVLSLALAVGAVVSCTGSDPVNNTHPTGNSTGNSTGNAGSGSGNAGSGSAGTNGNPSSGNAGSGSGNAGSGSGTAGTNATAGTNGNAGSGAGTAGTQGAGGSAAAGTNGSAGSSGGTGGGAGGGSGTGGGATLSFATDIYPIIMNKCKDCHTKATGPSGMLAMKDAATAYASLVGAAGTGVAAKTDMACTMLSAAKLRVVPSDPDHSFIYIKISQTQAALTAAKCGTAMPENNANGGVTADEKTKIHDWIMQGAKM